MKKSVASFVTVTILLLLLVLTGCPNTACGPVNGALTVKFNTQGGSSVPDLTGVTSGTTIIKPADPVKTGFTFDGWYKEETCINAWNFATDKVTANIVLYTKWTAVSVYVAGYETNGGHQVAKVWKDGVPLSLSLIPGRDSSAHSVFVSGNDVYVAGYEINGSGNQTAKIWKNGMVLHELAGGLNDATVNSLFVSEDTVYAAGYSGSVATLWSNGMALSTALNDGSYTGNSFSAYVIGNDVYAAGYEEEPTRRVAKVWKNGTTLYELSVGSEYAIAEEVIVYGSDVYAVGFESDASKKVAKVWKNGAVLFTLTGGIQDAEAESVQVYGNDVYTAGFEHSGTAKAAKVWKNDTVLYDLTDGTQDAYVKSISVYGGDVYAAGGESNGTCEVATLWKNGTKMPLTLVNKTEKSKLYSVFIK